MQGPYIYTLYKDQKDNPESVVAALITTGFVTAGITASFVGSLADRHGRKLACLCYCISYSISCLSVLSDDIVVLFVGRAFGGLSTTLQYTVFETWMISEYHKRDLSDCLPLGSMFSLSLTVSSIIAIVSGVIGEALVSYTGTKTSPFMLAIVLLVTAFATMHNKWSENYGEVTSEKSSGAGNLRDLLSDKRVLALGFNTTLFEGSMYLFVFFWSPAIISSRSLAGDESPPPFGVIFSCFMCAMMLGSFIFSSLKPEMVRDAATLMLSVLALATFVKSLPSTVC